MSWGHRDGGPRGRYDDRLFGDFLKSRAFYCMVTKAPFIGRVESTLKRPFILHFIVYIALQSLPLVESEPSESYAPSLDAILATYHPDSGPGESCCEHYGGAVRPPRRMV